MTQTVRLSEKPRLLDGTSTLGVSTIQRPKGQRDWGNHAPDGKVDTRKSDLQAEHLRAVEAFRKWVQTQPNLMTSVAELKGKVLVCHCKGLPCHGHVLKELANKPKKRGRPVSELGVLQRQTADELGVSLRTISTVGENPSTYRI